ncbi:MAG: bifunctional phosphoglucose/phosphomannose isomerase [Chloroflexi bacterium]|nr:bifunctional phosphoglucose/phosphomannose isomerase [Chloroflexota bacterium]
MLTHIFDLPDQIDQARARAATFNLPDEWKKPANVLLIGTGGGSGTAGELARACLHDQLAVPFVIASGYDLPAWANPHTLVIAASHSGTTEETLSTFHQARARGCRVIALTGGGTLAQDRGDVLPYPLQGRQMPRALIGEILVAIFHILHQAELIPDPAREWVDTITTLRAIRDLWTVITPTEQNRAKQIARLLQNHTPLIIGATPDTDAIALRWKRQFGENAKVLAFWSALPPLHHDEIVGWQADPLQRQFAVVLLRNPNESPAIKKRFDATRALLTPRAGVVIEEWATGATRLAQMFSLVLLGDYVSCYLALARDLDPTPVALIDELKRVMGQ